METILEDEIMASHAEIKNTVIADLSQVVSAKVDNRKVNKKRLLKMSRKAPLI